MRLLIVEPSPLPILIPLGRKYWPQNPPLLYAFLLVFLKSFSETYTTD
jgi:hypothetical protein